MRYLKYHVFLQGKKVEASSVSFTCGVGMLPTAAIVIPPRRNAFKIWPGTKVSILLETEESGDDLIWAFEGAVENYPAQFVGNISNAVTLSCASDFDTLRDAKVRFSPFSKTAKTSFAQWQQTFIGQKMEGSINIPSTRDFGVGSGIGSLVMSPKNSMREKLFGVLQALMLMSPVSYEILRRTQFLDRMLIEAAEDAASEFVKTEFWTHALAKIATINQEISIWDYLQYILKVIQHDVVSVCPYVKSKFDVPDRFKHFYAPSTFDEYIQENGAKITDYIGTKERKSVIEMFVKPSYAHSSNVPEGNVLYPSQYKGFSYSKSIAPTRGFFTVQANLGGKSPVGYGLRFKPDDINEAYAQTSRRSNKTAKAVTSRLVGTRGYDYTTNEERMTGIKSMYRGEIDMIAAKVIRGLNPKSDPSIALNDMMDYTWAQQRTGNMNVDGTFNIKTIPGFPMMFIDHKFGNHMIAYLNSRTCFMTADGTASTSYDVSGARPLRDVDFNKVIRDKDGLFGTFFGASSNDKYELPWVSDVSKDTLINKFGQKYFINDSYAYTTVEKAAQAQAPVVDVHHADVHDLMGNLGVVTSKTLTELKGGMPGVDGYEYKERFYVNYDILSNEIDDGKGTGSKVDDLDSLPADMGIMVIEANRTVTGFLKLVSKLGLDKASSSTVVVNSWKDIAQRWPQYATLAKDGIKIPKESKMLYFPTSEIAFLYNGNPGYPVTDLLLYHMCQDEIKKEDAVAKIASKISALTIEQAKIQKEFADEQQSSGPRELRLEDIAKELKVLERTNAKTSFGKMRISSVIPLPLSGTEVVTIRREIIESLLEEGNIHG